MATLDFSRAAVLSMVAICLAGCAEGTAPGPADDADFEPGAAQAGGSGDSSAHSGGAGGAGGSGGVAAGGAGTAGNLPAPGDLVVSELMANPDHVSDTFGEWVELYNASPDPIDLQGLLFRHETGSAVPAHSIATSVVIAPGGYVVLGKDPSPATNGGVVIDYVYPPDIGLTNTGDRVAIELADGTVIDETAWVEAAPLGASRSLDPLYLTAALNDDSAHFCDASTPLPQGDRGTPGAPNDACP